uniref:Uncharacterized protein n=1 Tax=Rousettus aegyptiacus TaxID=9407 RepID=A0A7J8HRJ4_ROUAE|nr:hypothetical protein HJG63_011066 [Rousettus aegyptiacus]
MPQGQEPHEDKLGLPLSPFQSPTSRFPAWLLSEVLSSSLTLKQLHLFYVPSVHLLTFSEPSILPPTCLFLPLTNKCFLPAGCCAWLHLIPDPFTTYLSALRRLNVFLLPYESFSVTDQLESELQC